mgnify:CR=1 FL=1
MPKIPKLADFPKLPLWDRQGQKIALCYFMAFFYNIFFIWKIVKRQKKNYHHAKLDL